MVRNFFPVVWRGFLCVLCHPYGNFWVQSRFLGKKFWLQNVFWPTNILDLKFFGPKFFGPKLIWSEKLFGQNILLSKIILDPKIFSSKMFFDPKFNITQNCFGLFFYSLFLTKHFWTLNILDLKLFGPKILFELQIFEPIIF